MEKRKGKPIQLFWVLFIMAWMTLGPTMEDFLYMDLFFSYVCCCRLIVGWMEWEMHMLIRVGFVLTARLVIPNRAKNMLS